MTDYSFVVWNRPFSTSFHPYYSCWIDHVISRCFVIAMAVKFSMHWRRKDSFDDCPATAGTSRWLVTALLGGTGHSPLNCTPISHVELIVWSVGASELQWQWNSKCIAGGKIVSTIALQQKALQDDWLQLCCVEQAILHLIPPQLLMLNWSSDQ